MTEAHDFQRYRENGMLEFMRAEGGLPESFWKTYSSFANTDGGLIVLGAAEKSDGTMGVAGLSDADSIKRDLWNGLNNEQKVSANLLLESDIAEKDIDGQAVILVRVPRADRTIRPVYINDNPKRGSYRRNGDGDYHCTQEELRAMMRDSAEGATDKLPLPNIGLEDLAQETIRTYRTVFDNSRPDHPWSALPDEEFLMRLGALGRSSEDGDIHPTRAGLLMFGQGWRITDEYPDYFLDCRLVSRGRRWDDRITSADGDWSGNVYDFYRKSQDMLTDGLPVPFELGSDMHRLSDTPQHKAIREGLVNALVHADYYGRTGIVAVRHPDRIEISNPGTLRLPVSVIAGGGISDPKNLTLFTMFNLVGLSEKAGSGFDVLRQAADWAHAEAPSLKETIEPDRVVLTMYVSSKADVGNDVGNHVGNVGNDVGNRVGNRVGNVGNHVGNVGNEADSIAGHDDESMDLTRTERAVLDGMRANPDATSKEIAAEVGISIRQVERARKTLRELGMIKRIGGTRGFWGVRP